MRINPPLVALSIGAFGIGVTEFAPMGMLPGIAADLDVSIPAAGLLVSAYAMGVLIGAPIMTLATARVPRRYLLIGLMAIFTLGNLLSALATDYQTLMIARLVTSLNHGAFFGIGSIVAASVVAPEKRAGAVAAMFLGLTLATIGGVVSARLHVSYDLESGESKRKAAPVHLSALVTHEPDIEPQLLISDIKRFLKNSFAGIDYEDISVVLSRRAPIQHTAPSPEPRSQDLTPLYLLLGLGLVLAAAWALWLYQRKRSDEAGDVAGQ